MSEIVCPECGNSYKGVASHWSKSDCSPPDFTNRQREVLTGALLVGGRIAGGTSDRNPNITIESTNEPLLEWIHDELGLFARGDGPNEVATPDELRERLSELNPDQDMSGRTFHSQYRVETRSLDRLISWQRRWYDETGSRTVPTEVSPSPLSLRVAFALNGRIETTQNGRDTPVIGVTRSGMGREVAERLFSRYGVRFRDSEGKLKVYLFNGERFFNDIGWTPLPGCADRWPTPESLDEPNHVCPSCNGRFSALGTHWSKTSVCSPPKLTSQQQSVLNGLLWLSGTIIRKTTKSETPQIQLSSANKTALEYASEGLGWLSAGLSVAESATEASERLSQAHNKPITNANDLYVLRSWSHSELLQYHDPTDGVGKVVPKDIPCRPETLRVLYEFHGRRVTRSSGSVDRIIFNTNNLSVGPPELHDLLSDFDSHMESSTYPSVVVKNVSKFDAFLEPTRNHPLETIFRG